MTFKEVIDFMIEHGIGIVFSAVCAFFLIKLIIFGFQLAEAKVSENKIVLHAEHNTRFKITPPIKSVLKDLRLHSHACRAYVFEFHNGTTSAGGLPFLGMSCTYEVLGPTATSQIHARQKMPFTIFDSLVQKIVKDETVVVDTRNRDDDLDAVIYETIIKRGTKLLVATKLLDEHKRIIGFLGIDYCVDLESSIIGNGENQIKEIEKIVFREAQVLSTLLYAKITKED